jgi:hypothetical protein
MVSDEVVVDRLKQSQFFLFDANAGDILYVGPNQGVFFYSPVTETELHVDDLVYTFSAQGYTAVLKVEESFRIASQLQHWPLNKRSFTSRVQQELQDNAFVWFLSNPFNKMELIENVDNEFRSVLNSMEGNTKRD